MGQLGKPGPETVMGRLRAYGGWAMIGSPDFLIAVAGTSAVTVALGLTGKLSLVATRASGPMAGFAGVLIGMVLAGMSIAATSDARFLALLARCGDLCKVIWLYESSLYACFAAALVNVLALIWLGSPNHAALTLARGWPLGWLAAFVIVSGLFLFAYAVLSAIMIVPGTARFFIYRGEVAEFLNNERTAATPRHSSPPDGTEHEEP